MNQVLGSPRMSPSTQEVYDLLAIGCGPFNLSVLAMAHAVPELKVVAFEREPEFRWHPGLMFEDAGFQLSFLGDLVSLIDPTNPYSFLAYLRARDRLYPFYIREEFHPTRREYEDYLRWVAGQLSNLHLAHEVVAVGWLAERECFFVEIKRRDSLRLRYFARHLVMGIGTEPHLISALQNLPTDRCFHSAKYLHQQDTVERARHVTVVGSGQSAAEVVLDLLRKNLAGGPQVSWITRARSFAPLDYSKLVLEMTTPAYIRYFHGLDVATRDRLVAEQWHHYKGISTKTIDQIHDALYQREFHDNLAPVELRCASAVESSQILPDGRVELMCRHRDTDSIFALPSDLVIAATGYTARKPTFLEALAPAIARDERGRLKVRLDFSVELDPACSGRLFVANAELHTHGVATPDLGISAFRSANILNTLMQREVFRLPKHTAYTTFCPPKATEDRQRDPNLAEHETEQRTARNGWAPA